jgi:hypothetical protein
MDNKQKTPAKKNRAIVSAAIALALVGVITILIILSGLYLIFFTSNSTEQENECKYLAEVFDPELSQLKAHSYKIVIPVESRCADDFNGYSSYMNTYARDDSNINEKNRNQIEEILRRQGYKQMETRGGLFGAHIDGKTIDLCSTDLFKKTVRKPDPKTELEGYTVEYEFMFKRKNQDRTNYDQCGVPADKDVYLRLLVMEAKGSDFSEF